MAGISMLQPVEQGTPAGFSLAKAKGSDSVMVEAAARQVSFREVQ